MPDENANSNENISFNGITKLVLDILKLNIHNTQVIINFLHLYTESVCMISITNVYNIGKYKLAIFLNILVNAVSLS